jgi:WXG100 family type VII secretion target
LCIIRVIQPIRGGVIMPARVVKGDFDGLAKLAKVFAGEAQTAQQSYDRLKQQVEVLRGGDWSGKGAKAFYREMDGMVLTAFARLQKAMEGGDGAVRRASKILQDAEDEASRLFAQIAAMGVAALGGGAAATAGAGAAGGSGRGAGGSGAGGGLSPEATLIGDLLNALNTAGGAAGLFGKLKGAERILAIAESTSMKGALAILSGAKEALDASGRGVSSVGAGIDGAIGAVASILGKPVEGVVGLVHNVTDAISPGAGRYTAVLNDAMPTNVGKSLATGTVDTVDALVRGDYKQLALHHDQNLDGKYGEVVRGYAIAADSIGALVTGDSARLNKISDLASGGKLGPLAEFGDWLGGKVYDWTH